MTLIQFLNLAFILIAVNFALSYYWSFYTFKLFKPFVWLNARKKGQIPKMLLRRERGSKDRILFYTLWLQLNRISANQTKGDLAEIGNINGETAGLIHHSLPDRALYLFNDSDGQPKQIIREDCDGNVGPEVLTFEKTSTPKLLQIINGNGNLRIMEGNLTRYTEAFADKSFAFAHVNTFLYQPTLEAIAFFYPRLSSGGALLIQHYNHNWEGVRKAVDEFAEKIAEPVTEMPDMYGSVLIIKK